MKRILVLLAAIATVFSLMLCFTSCNGGEGEGEGGGEQPGGETITVYDTQTFIYSDSEVMVLLGTGGADRGSADDMIEYLDKYVVGDSGKGDAYLGTIYSVKEVDNEIIVGYVDSRDISKKAYQLLDRIDSKSVISECRYIVYAEGGKIAIAFDENPYSTIQAGKYVMEKFIAEHVKGKSTLLFDKGVVMSGVIDLLDIQEQIDKKFIDETWEKLKEKWKETYGSDDLYWAFRTYYSMFSDELPEWWANLYDPGMGCFYATPSGRDTEDILPNPESTRQILGHISSTKMISTLNRAMTDYLPYYLQAQMVYYCKYIQDSNGYFYLPQLGKAATDSAVSRRGRDIASCVSVLSTFGEQPRYNTPTGVRGDGQSADAYWETTGLPESLKPVIPEMVGASADKITDKISVSAVNQVSKVVAAGEATAVSDSTSYMKDPVLLVQYLESLNIDAQPYSVGNELNATYAQIGNYSKTTDPYYSPAGTPEDQKPWYEGMTLCEIMITWLNSKINDYGLFGDDKNPDTADVLFQNTNGMMKIISIYNGYGYAFPEPEKAAAGILTGIMGDEPSTGNICEVYNCWCALSGLMSNVNTYIKDKDLKERVLGTISDTLGELGPAAVLNSYKKQSGYMKPHGTFSHSYVGGTTTHQGGLVVGLGLDEGNVDAIGFGTCSIVSFMSSCIGVEMVPIYTESDWMRFCETIDNLDPVIKYDYKMVGTVPDVYTFDGEELPQTGIKFNIGNESNEIKAIDIERDGEINGVLFIDKNSNASGSNTSFAVSKFNSKAENPNMIYYEVDVLMKDLTSRSQIQMQFGNSTSSNMASMQVLFILSPQGLADGSAIHYTGYNNGAGDGTNVNIGAKVGEWFNLRVELYYGDKDTFRYQLYVNDYLVYTSASIYSKDIVSGAKPTYGADKFNYASLAMNQGFIGEFYFDNLVFAQGVKTLSTTEVGIPDGFNPDDVGGSDAPPAPVDPPVDFENGQIPDYMSLITTEGNSATVVDKGEGKALMFDKSVSAGDGHTQRFTYNKVNKTVKDAAIAAMGFDLLVENNTGGNGIEFYPDASTGKSYLGYITVSGGKVYYQHNASGNKYELGAVGEWISFEFKYYTESASYVISNGESVYGPFTGLFRDSYKAPANANAFQGFAVNIGTSMVGDYYFDNLYLNLESEDTAPGEGDSGSTEVIPGVSTFDEMPANVTISFYDYNKNGGSDGITVSIVDKDGDKALEIDKQEDDTVYNSTFITEGGKKDVAVYSTDIFIDSEANHTNLEFYIRSGDSNIFMVLFGMSDGFVTMRDYGKAEQSSAVNTEVTLGQWFNFRVEVYENSGVLVYDVYMNGVLVMQGYRLRVDTAPAASKITGFRMNINAPNRGKYYFDNVAAYYASYDAVDRTLESSRVDAPENVEKPNPVYTFDQMLEGCYSFYDYNKNGSSDGITVSIVDKGEGNKALMYDKNEEDTAYFKYMRFDREDPAANVVEFSVDILVENFEKKSDLEFYLKNRSDTPVYLTLISFAGMENGSAVSVCDYGSTGRTEYVATTGVVGDWFTFTMRYFPAEQCYDVLVNGEYVMTGFNLRGSATPPTADGVGGFSVTIGRQNLGDIYFDNAYSYKIYDRDAKSQGDLNTDEGGEGGSEEPEAPAVDLGAGYGAVAPHESAEKFDQMPASSSLYVSGSSGTHSVTVVKMGEGTESVLHVNKTGKDAGMGVRYTGATATVEGANKVTLSADILIKNVSSLSQLQFQFGNKSHTSQAEYAGLILISFQAAEGSVINIRPFNNGSAATEYATSAKVGEWFNFKVEFFEGALGEANYNIYINGALICNSTDIYSKKIHGGELALYSASEMDMMVISMNQALAGDFYYDNMSIVQEKVANSAE